VLALGVLSSVAVLMIIPVESAELPPELYLHQAAPACMIPVPATYVGVPLTNVNKLGDDVEMTVGVI
jgi:hypothetical protein